MPELLIPSWYEPEPPSNADMFVSAFFWGCSAGVAAYSLGMAVCQTYRCWTRCGRVNAYIVMIWLVWFSCIISSVLSGMFLMRDAGIPPSFWYFLSVVILWIIQTQCLMQILANRLSLILYNPDRARKIKITLAVLIGIINISVACIWIPARLQITETWERVNFVWDRTEKVLYLLIDTALNGYFMYLIKSKLVANGLTKYRIAYRFNMGTACGAIFLDALILGMMSLPDDAVYVQIHPLAFLVKLHIEMNMAELLGKVIRRANRQRTSFSTIDGTTTTCCPSRVASHTTQNYPYPYGSHYHFHHSHNHIHSNNNHQHSNAQHSDFQPSPLTTPTTATMPNHNTPRHDNEHNHHLPPHWTGAAGFPSSRPPSPLSSRRGSASHKGGCLRVIVGEGVCDDGCRSPGGKGVPQSSSEESTREPVPVPVPLAPGPVEGLRVTSVGRQA